MQEARERAFQMYAVSAFRPFTESGYSVFQNCVVSAFRRTGESPAEAGHYVLHGNGNCSSESMFVSADEESASARANSSSPPRRRRFPTGRPAGVRRRTA